MFLTFTPNPCIERTVRLDVLVPNGSQRVASSEVFVSAGGKGVNAARVAAYFGASVLATGPIGRRQSQWVQNLAQTEGVATDFVRVEADTRLCLNLLHLGGQKTEIIEAGEPFSALEGAKLLEKWVEWLPQTRLACIGGSYPPFEESVFNAHGALLCELAHKAGVPLIYDGKGEPFQRALSSKTPPWAIKPNLDEAQATLNTSLETPAQERQAVRTFLKRGIEVVLLSCGERGLYLGHAGGVEWFAAPKVETLSAVGSGDALVGAFAAKWLENGDVFEAARWGVAAGSANAGQQKPAFVRPEAAAALLSQVKRATQEIALTSF